MKRHKSLIPLSHDHHHGLMVAQLCKKDAPPYKGLPRDANGKAAYAVSAWENEISIHFKNEEEILFPFVKGTNAEIDKLISEILSEHQKIESHFKKIRTEENLIENLDTLGKDLEAHIRKEERIVFKLIQEKLGDKLDQLENKIKPAKDISCKKLIMLSNKEFYNELSSDYGGMISISEAIKRRSKILAHIIEPNDKVADIGCGIGIDSITSAKLGCDVTAFDPSEKMVEETLKNAADFNVEIKTGVFAADAIPKKFHSKFDKVISLGNTFANISEDKFKQSLNNIIFLAKPGGSIIIQLLNYEKVLAEKERIVNITSSDNFQFIRFYDFTGSKIYFNLLKFEQSNPSNRSLITTEIYPYLIVNFKECLNKHSNLEYDFFGSLNFEKFDRFKSKDLVLKILRTD